MADPRDVFEWIARHLAPGGLEVERHGSTTSAPAWNMSIRNSLGMDALTKHKSVFEVFNYSNVFTLSAFTALDLALMLVGLPTSTQKLIARKPRSGAPSARERP